MTWGADLLAALGVRRPRFGPAGTATRLRAIADSIPALSSPSPGESSNRTALLGLSTPAFPAGEV
jgi:hypothetical protein